MFQLIKKGGNKIGGILIGAQILVIFLVPLNTALAAAFGSGSESPTTAFPVCFTVDSSGAGGSGLINLCYAGPGLAACTAAQAAWAAGDIKSSCKNILASMTPAQVKSADLASRSVWEKTKAAVKDGVAAIGDGAMWLVWSVLELIAQLIHTVAGVFMRAMGDVLDMSISRTIDSHTYKDLSVVRVGWTAMRDFSNMFFIFILLFIAIQTILGLAGGSAKRWLSHVIIAALLINFSLFFTGVVIDAGNVLAMGFWNKITTPMGGTSISTASAPFLEAFKIQTAFDPAGETSPKERTMIYIGGALVMLVAGYVFLAGAVMMIIRTVTLLILMIVSPFAFLGFALPKGGGFADTWLKKLISNAFVAPAFLAMLYLDAIIIRSTDAMSLTGVTNSTLGAAFKGTASSFDIIYQFILMIILLLASLTVANQVSSGAGNAGGTWAKKMIGGGAAMGFAGGAMLGRQTIGSTAHQKLQDKEWVKEQNRLVAAGGMRGRLANMQLAGYEKAAKGSFDIRNAPMGGLGVTSALKKTGIDTGTGSKKSFATHGEVLSSVTPGGYRGTEKEKELIATAKARFPGDPAAQKAFLEQRNVNLGADRNKDVHSQLDRDAKKKGAKDAIDEQTEKQKTLDAAVASGAKTKEVAQIEGAAIAEEVGKALKLLSVTERAELAEKYKDNKAYLANMSKGDLAAVHRMEIDGKFKGPVMQDVSQGILNLDGDKHVSTQSYILNPETQEKLFSIDTKSLNTDQYTAAKARVEAAKAADAAAKKASEASARSSRWQELFMKGAKRTPEEEVEFKGITST